MPYEEEQTNGKFIIKFTCSEDNSERHEPKLEHQHEFEHGREYIRECFVLSLLFTENLHDKNLCVLVPVRMDDLRSNLPEVVLRGVDEARDSVLNNSGGGDEDNNNNNINNNQKKTVWQKDAIGIIRGILPLIEVTEDGMEINYNFTHLSNILKIDKEEIYAKLMELYYGGDDFTDVVPNPATIDDIETPASEDSIINVTASSKYLHKKNPIVSPSPTNSFNSESNKSIDSMQESLLQREVLEELDLL